MNSRGKIMVANHDGTYLLRFEGDVRLTLCVAIDEFLHRMFDDPNFTAVVVDLSAAQGLDSTSLGILAKLAKEARNKTAQRPILVCNSADVLRSLTSLGIDDLFEPAGSEFADYSAVTPLGALEANEPSEDDTRRRVLEAHRVLMSLNPANADQFRDLVTQLEALDETPRARGKPQGRLG